jgi:hypothetical protein
MTQRHEGGILTAERFPVEAGHIMMFARAIGDANPIYADGTYAAGSELGGIIAPPTFVQASAQFDPDYPLRPKPGAPWHGSGREPTGTPPGSGGGRRTGGGGLHAEQHFTYYRNLHPGEVLTATVRPGSSWEREGRRGGKLLFSEGFTDYRDEKGELVVTARFVGVRTERTVEEP